MIFSIKPQIFELKCVFSYFRLKTHITLLLPVYVHSWEQRKVTEIGKIYIGLVTTMTKHYTDEGTLLIRNSDIKDGKFEFGDNPIYLEKTFAEKNETRMHQIGDVITVHTGDVGTSAVITENEAKSIGFATIVTRPNPKIIDSNYLCSFLNTDKHKKWAVSISTGDGRTNYNLGDYFELVVPVPSIAEQKKIASYIQKLNRLITLHQCKCQIDGCRFQSPLAITWEQRKLIDVCDYVDYRGKTPTKTDSGVFLVTAKNVKDGYIDYGVSQEYISEDDYEEVMHRGKPEIGDVLITTEAPCGNVAQVNRADIALAQRIIKYRGQSNIVDNTYLKDYLQSPEFQNILNAKSSGGTVKGIKGSILHQQEIKYPKYEEQFKIGSYFNNLDNLITLHQRKPVVVNSSSTMNALPNQHLYFQVLE